MSSGTSRLSTAGATGVFWDLDHCPIPNDLTPASISDNIKSALSNMGYTNGEVSINAYTDTEHIGEEFESAGIKLIHLGDNRLKRGEILSDMCMWACHHRRERTNVLLISKDVSKDKSYVKALLDIRSRAHYILLAQPLNASGLLRTIPSYFWIWTSLSIGGLPLGVSQEIVTPSPTIADDQSGSSQIVTPSPTRFLTAETVVFWDLGDCPIPSDLSLASIDANIRAALKNLGYIGKVSILAYAQTQAEQIKKEEFDLVNINLSQIHIPGGAHAMMNGHIYQWWGRILRDEPGNLLVISGEDIGMFVDFSHSSMNDNNLLLAHPQYTTEEIPCAASSIWLWDSLSYGGNPFYNRDAYLSPTASSAAETCVLWDLDKCRITEDLNICLTSDNIKSALNNMGYTGHVSIIAYTDEHIDKDFEESDGIKLMRLETNLSKYERMFLDACLWGTRNQPSNLMVISSKQVFDSDFVDFLAKIRNRGHQILLALPHHPSRLLLDTARYIWRWNSLSIGGPPLDNQSVTPSPTIGPPLDDQSGSAKKKMKRGVKACSSTKRKRSASSLSKE